MNPKGFIERIIGKFLDRFGAVESVRLFNALLDNEVCERFWSLVSVDEWEECWEWQGSIDPKGYGTFEINNRYEQAHQLAWINTMGLIGGGLYAQHACGNKICCNPEHMFLDTKGGVV